MIAKSNLARLENKCITEGCNNAINHTARGLCPSCYNTARELVRRGATTWEDLEGMGMVAPRKRAVLGAFRMAFEGRVAGVGTKKAAKKTARA